MSNYSKYDKKRIDNPLPDLKEEERIYLKVHPTACYTAQKYNCGFDATKKLWFTGPYNAHLKILIKIYRIHGATSATAMASIPKDCL